MVGIKAFFLFRNPFELPSVSRQIRFPLPFLSPPLHRYLLPTRFPGSRKPFTVYEHSFVLKFFLRPPTFAWCSGITLDAFFSIPSPFSLVVFSSCLFFHLQVMIFSRFFFFPLPVLLRLRSFPDVEIPHRFLRGHSLDVTYNLRQTNAPPPPFFFFPIFSRRVGPL